VNAQLYWREKNESPGFNVCASWRVTEIDFMATN
jgi:hypothetical protein